MEENKQGARIKGAHSSAKTLLKNAGVTGFPVRIRDLVPSIISDYPTIKFHNTDRLPSSVYALTYKEDGNVDIAFNNTVSLNRQKFSFAHELGHLYMGHVHGGSGIDFDSANQAEVEANEFAAELLMPRATLRKVLKDNPTTMNDLVAMFEVSEEALWWRVQKTGLWKLLKANS